MSVVQEREAAVIVWEFLEAQRAKGERSPANSDRPARTDATQVAVAKHSDETEGPAAAELSARSKERSKSKSFALIGSVVLVAIAGIGSLAYLWSGAKGPDSIALAIRPLTTDGQALANLPSAAPVVPAAVGSRPTEGELKEEAKIGTNATGQAQQSGSQGTARVSTMVLESVRVPVAVAPRGSAVTDGKTSNHPTLPYSANSVSQSQVVPSTDAPEVLNVNGADKDGMTPLMNAALAGQETTAISLLEKGAKVNAKNIYGRTALMLAAQGGYLGIARALIDHSADPSIKGKRGETALALARLNGHGEVVRILRDAECRKSKKKGCSASPGGRN